MKKLTPEEKEERTYTIKQACKVFRTIMVIAFIIFILFLYHYETSK
jgi:hypothetical protein